MKFYSLNKRSSVVSFKEATILGQAPDKGLYFPEHIPVFDPTFFNDIEKLSNEEIAFQVILPYVNENRVLSVFSKEGEISEPNEIGHYIKMVVEDAINDFEKDYDCSGLDKNQRKQIFKSGNKEIVKVLEKYL